MPKNYFSNHEVFWEAVKKSHAMFKVAEATQNRLGKNPNIKYDRRNLYSLILLTLDLSDIPENQQESYLIAEYEKMHSAFETPDPKIPTRSDPEKVKPYIKKMFDSITITDLSTVDFNDTKQIQKIIHTMLSTQMLATMVKDYPSEAMELYPTHEDKMRIDVLSSKAYALHLEARVEMSYAGLDGIGEYFNKTLGGKARKSTAELLQATLNNKVFDTYLSGTDTVMLDPAADELSTRFFMNESFSVTNDLGNGPEDFTQDDYAKFYVEHLAGSMLNTSFEYQVVKPAIANSSKLEESDLLIINGKPLGQLLNDYKAQGYGWPDKEKLAGHFLREALLKGEPVTLITTSFTKDGEIRFNNKDIKLDLDKIDVARLNQEHFDSYHPFRQWLHKIGLFPIRSPYLTNEQRDKKQAKMKNSFRPSHQRKIKELEKEIVKAYNGIDRSRSSPSGCARDIVHLTRVEAKLNAPETKVIPETEKKTEISRNNEIERVKIDLKDFNKQNDAKVEAPKTTEEKVLDKNSIVK